MEKTKKEVVLKEQEVKSFMLVIYNDNVNTFEWVIESLIKVCKHQTEQAIQCTYLIHHKGSCIVKHGDFDETKLLCDAICERGIDGRIELIPTRI